MKEVLKLALNALKCCYDVDSFPANGKTIQDKAIAAIKEALSEQALDMVQQANPKGLFVDMIESHGREFVEEINSVGKSEAAACKPLCELCVKRGYDFCANAAKTTPIIIPTPSPQQAEPVAWAMPRKDGLILDVICPDEHESHEGEYTIPLYTTPPQPTWQGLTGEEVRSLWDGHTVPVFGKTGINPIVFARAIEARLREKNA